MSLHILLCLPYPNINHPPTCLLMCFHCLILTVVVVTPPPPPLSARPAPSHFQLENALGEFDFLHDERHQHHPVDIVELMSTSFSISCSSQPCSPLVEFPDEVVLWMCLSPRHCDRATMTFFTLSPILRLACIRLLLLFFIFSSVCRRERTCKKH